MKKKIASVALLLNFMVCIDHTFALPSNGLVAAWNFSGNPRDSSGNNNHGTVNGARLTTDRFGRANSAYEFDGKSNIRVNNSSFLNSTNFTISAWVNIVMGAPPGMNIIGKDGKNHSRQYLLSTRGLDSEKFTIHAANSDGEYQTLPGTTTPLRGQWYHVVQTYNGEVLKLYINGVSESMRPYTNEDNGVVSSTQPVQIGGYGSASTGESWFAGKIDDIFIYNRSLSDTEIRALYTAVPGAVSEPPVYLLFALGLFGLIYYKKKA